MGFLISHGLRYGRDKREKLLLQVSVRQGVKVKLYQFPYALNPNLALGSSRVKH